MKNIILYTICFIILQNQAEAQLSWGTKIGQTYYDLASNASQPNRIVRNSDGSLSVVWMEHWDILTTDNEPKENIRGFGYNHFNDSIWLYGDDGECWGDNYGCASSYVGWPQIVNLEDANSNGNKELVISHKPLQMTSRTEIGIGNWGNTTNIGINLSQDPDDYIWPRAVTSGQYIHLINPLLKPDTVIPISSNSILNYYRSSDGGITWDIIEYEFDLISEIESSYLITNIDSSTFTVNDSTLAYQVVFTWDTIYFNGFFVAGDSTFNADSFYVSNISTYGDSVFNVSSDTILGDTFVIVNLSIYDSVPLMDTTYSTYDSIVYYQAEINLVNNVSGDGYAIHTNGSNVAITFGSGIDNDWMLFKSTDKGDTWTRTIIKNNHNLDTAIIAANGDWGAITNNDQFDILIDNDGKVHCFASMGYMSNFGREFYINAQDYLNGGNGWEESLGILYWNDEDGLEPRIIATPDYSSDGNDEDYTANGSAYYGHYYCGWPTAAFDDNGNIALVYSVITEDIGVDYITDDGTDTLGYHDLYLIYSTNNGSTWGDIDSWNFSPINIAEDIFGIIGSTPTEDDVFPSLAKNIGTDGLLHLTWQGDYSRPGLALYDDTHPNDQIYYIQYAKIDMNNTFKNIKTLSNNNLKIYPNPAKSIINFESTRNIESIHFYNNLGSLILEINSTYSNTKTLDVSSLQKGIYFLRIETELGITNKKLIIE